MTKQKQQDVELGWVWTAAVACEERALAGEAWGAGDEVAETLLTRVAPAKRHEDATERLIRVLEDGSEAVDPAELVGEGRAPPGSAQAWREEAERLWRQLGLEVRPERWATPGRIVDVTPYHLRVETDPAMPYFQRRALDRPDPQLAASLLLVGRNLRLIDVVPSPGLLGGLPIVVAGRGRTSAARLANRQGLDQVVSALRSAEDPATMPPPQILGLAGFGSRDGEVRLEIQALGDAKAAARATGLLASRDTTLRLIGCLRVEVIDPASPLAVQAALVDNDGQRVETPLSNARQIRDMRGAFLEIHGRKMQTQEVAALKRVSSDTIANWEALLQLVPFLQGKLDDDQLSEAEAYKLARLPQNRQQAVYEKTRGFASVAERTAAIARLAKGEQEPLPSSGPRFQVPGRKQLGRAVERMQALPQAPAESARAGARAVLRLMAGHEGALEGLPAEVADEVRQLLADETAAAPAKSRKRGNG